MRTKSIVVLIFKECFEVWVDPSDQTISKASGYYFY